MTLKQITYTMWDITSTTKTRNALKVVYSKRNSDMAIAQMEPAESDPPAIPIWRTFHYNLEQAIRTLT